jgi:hypothetical protein
MRYQLRQSSVSLSARGILLHGSALVKFFPRTCAKNLRRQKRPKTAGQKKKSLQSAGSSFFR